MSKCDVDDDRVGGDRNEDLLERQCICENQSFDVANVAGQCQGCIEQHYQDKCKGRNKRDDDDDSDDECDDDDDGREGTSCSLQCRCTCVLLTLY